MFVHGTSAKKTISSEETSLDPKPNIMSAHGTSSKKTISDEAASPKDHMSSKNAALPKSIFAQAASSSSVLFLDELQVGVIGTIIVMLCIRMTNIAHNFLKLKEGGIYSIKNFVVHPNKEEYRVRKYDAFMLEFDGATNKLYLSSSSSTLIWDDADIHALQELRSENSGEKCKKGVGRKLRGWWCDSCDQAVEYPVLRFSVTPRWKQKHKMRHNDLHRTRY
ncbi:hypothetical protein Tco_0295520 [Tanacetum coccineum]